MATKPLCEHRRKAPKHEWIPVGEARPGTRYDQCPCCGGWRQVLTVCELVPSPCAGCAPVTKKR